MSVPQQHPRARLICARASRDGVASVLLDARESRRNVLLLPQSRAWRVGVLCVRLEALVDEPVRALLVRDRLALIVLELKPKKLAPHMLPVCNGQARVAVVVAHRQRVDEVLDDLFGAFRRSRCWRCTRARRRWWRGHLAASARATRAARCRAGRRRRRAGRRRFVPALSRRPLRRGRRLRRLRRPRRRRLLGHRCSLVTFCLVLQTMQTTALQSVCERAGEYEDGARGRAGESSAHVPTIEGRSAGKLSGRHPHASEGSRQAVGLTDALRPHRCMPCTRSASEARWRNRVPASNLSCHSRPPARCPAHRRRPAGRCARCSPRTGPARPRGAGSGSHLRQKGRCGAWAGSKSRRGRRRYRTCLALDPRAACCVRL